MGCPRAVAKCVLVSRAGDQHVQCLEVGNAFQKQSFVAIALGLTVKNSKPLMKLKFVKPDRENGKVVVRPLGVRKISCKEWEFTLVGHFIG